MRRGVGYLRLPGARSRATMTLASIAVFLGSWTLLHHLVYAQEDPIGDTGEYQSYAQQTVVNGMIPYRNFSVEYPPGFLVPMLAPDATATPTDLGSYMHAFERWMAGAGVVLLLFAGASLNALRARPKRFALALGFMAVSPLLLGTLMLSRYDLWVAALAAGGLSALLTGRNRVAAVLVGAAIATKLWPAVLVPLGLAWLWRRHGRASALRWLTLVVAVCAAFFLPFAALAPGGLGHSFGLQIDRPLQIESLGSAILLAAHNLVGVPVSVVTSYGSQNVVSSAAPVFANAASVLQLIGLCAVWVSFARGPARPERLATAAAAAIAVLAALGKVFSPQYLIWLIPFVPLARSRLATLLLALALVSTQFYFPANYQALTGLEQWAAWIVLARDLLVVMLAVELVRALLRRRPLESAAASLERTHTSETEGRTPERAPAGEPTFA